MENNPSPKSEAELKAAELRRRLEEIRNTREDALKKLAEERARAASVKPKPEPAPTPEPPKAEEEPVNATEDERRRLEDYSVQNKTKVRLL